MMRAVSGETSTVFYGLGPRRHASMCNAKRSGSVALRHTFGAAISGRMRGKLTKRRFCRDGGFRTVMRLFEPPVLPSANQSNVR